MNTDRTPTTKRDSYQHIKEAGEDEPLRRRVAAAIAQEPATTAELADRFPDYSNNAVQPRVNELLRMDCVVRQGKRENPSGHTAYIHHITERGKRYVDDEIDPDPTAPLAELKDDVVDVARSFCAGAATEDELRQAVKDHDGVKLRRNPDWSPDHVLDSKQGGAEPVPATDGGADAGEQPDEIPDGLTEAEIEKIESDPVLSLSDFRED